MTYPIDTLPRPVTPGPWVLHTYSDTNDCAVDCAVVCHCPGESWLQTVAEVSDRQCGRAIASLPEWIAEAERWRRTAEVLAEEVGGFYADDSERADAERLAEAYEATGDK